MTYITLTEELKNRLIQNFKNPVDLLVRNRIIQDPNFNGVNSLESIQIKNTHRNTIVKQGRADFDVDSDGLTATQKVELYCYYYFQMHFTSSYVFYLTESDFLVNILKDKHTVFIDIGCGPYTSGVAFNSWYKKHIDSEQSQVNYMGIDTANAMVEKSWSIISNFGDLVYKTNSISNNLNDIFNYLPSINSKKEIFIINYSYLFASHSLDVNIMVDFTNRLRKEYPQTKIIVLQQNPKTDSLNIKWNEYKTKLPNLSSKETYPKLLGFQFDDVLNSTKYVKPNFTVKCDILKSF